MAKKLNLFEKSRLSVDDLLQQSVEYCTTAFKQASNLFSASSAYGQIILVLTNLAQLVFYYIEDSITELNINDATRASSIYGLARLAGHNPTRAVSAVGRVTLVQTQDVPRVDGGSIILSTHSKLLCSNSNLPYIIDFQTSELRISHDFVQTIDCIVRQGVIDQQFFQGTGLPLQSFEVMYRQGQMIDNEFVSVYVNGDLWHNYESFYDMPSKQRCCMIKTGITSGLDIYFGNDAQGAIPPLGSEIVVEYLVTSGVSGTMDGVDPESILFKPTDVAYDIRGNELDMVQYFRVVCTETPEMGSNPEPIAITRLVAPKTSRSLIFAHPDNYVAYFSRFNTFSLVHAWTKKFDEDLQDDNVVYIMLIPDISKKFRSGENYFSIDSSRFLLTAGQQRKIIKMLDDSGKKIVKLSTKLVNPTVRRFVIYINLILFKDSATDEIIKNEVIDKVGNYFATTRRRDRIPRSDLITIIETIEGVDSTTVQFISEEDEAAAILGKPLLPATIDEFGDIILHDGDFPMVRGGWSDKRSNKYAEGLSSTGLGCVNISIRGRTEVTYNSKLTRLKK